MTGVTERTHRDRHKEEDHVIAEAEIEVMQLQAKEFQGLSEGTKSYEEARKPSSPESSEGA